MAIAKQLKLENNFGESSYIDCYVRVSVVTLQKTKARVIADVMSADQSKILDKDVFEFEVQESLPNVWAQAYNYMKSQEKYSGARDC